MQTSTPAKPELAEFANLLAATLLMGCQSRGEIACDEPTNGTSGAGRADLILSHAERPSARKHFTPLSSGRRARQEKPAGRENQFVVVARR